MFTFLYLGSVTRIGSLAIGDTILVIGGPQRYISFRRHTLDKMTYDEGILYAFRVKKLKGICISAGPHRIF